MTWAKGHIGARWLAEDDNGDTLEYKVEIRGVNETAWKLVRDKVRESYLSWDSTAYADGKYVLRVTASDAPSNPPDQALTGVRESDPFLIDNTPPEITWRDVSGSSPSRCSFTPRTPSARWTRPSIPSTAATGWWSSRRRA